MSSSTYVLTPEQWRLATQTKFENGKEVHALRVVSSTFEQGGSLDAFGRLRVAPPQTLLDSKLVSNAQPTFWDDVEVSGGGTSSTYQANQASVEIGVSNTVAGKRVRQSKQRANYQPGKSQLVFLTGIIGAASAGNTKRLGYFDDANGVFFSMTGNGAGVAVRTSSSGAPVDTVIAQADWNIDPLDGSGLSGLALDFTKTQIFIIDFEWLGVGSIRFGFVVDGVIYYCHQVNNANNLALVYMSNPNLPIRYSIENDGSGAADIVTCICSTVISEGGREETGLVRAADRGSTALAVNATATLFSIIAIRLNDVSARVFPTSISVINSSNDPFVWRLILNPTLAGGSYTWNAETNSPVDVAIPANTLTYNASSGIELASGYSAADVAQNISVADLKLGSTVAGVSDIIALSIERITGAGSENIYGSIGWNEII